MPAQPNGSLIQGMACLQAVLTAGVPIGSREVARRLSLVHTRTNRLLGTLAQLGLLEQDAKRRYRPGPGLHVLAAQSLMGSPLLGLALEHLAPWHQEGFTVALGVLWRDQVCFLLHARPGQALHASIGRHELWPAELTAAGLALLAGSDMPLPAADPEKGASLAEEEQDLAACVARTRRDGWAMRRWRSGEASLGAVVGAPPVAAIAISHAHLAQASIAALAQRLQATAGAMAGRLESKE